MFHNSIAFIVFSANHYREDLHKITLLLHLKRLVAYKRFLKHNEVKGISVEMGISVHLYIIHELLHFFYFNIFLFDYVRIFSSLSQQLKYCSLLQ